MEVSLEQSLLQHFIVVRKKVFFVRAVVQSCKVFVNGYSQSATEVPRFKVAPGSSEKGMWVSSLGGEK